jgi:hypothetical protein
VDVNEIVAAANEWSEKRNQLSCRGASPTICAGCRFRTPVGTEGEEPDMAISWACQFDTMSSEITQILERLTPKPPPPPPPPPPPSAQAAPEIEVEVQP